MSRAPHLPIDADLLRLFGGLLEERFGLRFHDGNIDLLEGGLQRLAAAHKRPVSDLLQRLLLSDASDDLLQSVVQAVTIGETYFFRHPEHFELLSKDIVPGLLRASRGRVRALSVGCSTGEEAYSLSMVLIAAGLPDVRVLGCDVNRVSLQLAEQARYGRRSLRATSPLLERYLLPLRESGEHVVAPSVRQVTQFRSLNLGHPAELATLGRSESFDLIFCRNVLVYFSPRHALRVIEQLRDLLNPGGYLVLSALDVPESVRGLERVLLSGVPVLHRPAARSASAHPAPLGLPASPEPALLAATSTVEAPSKSPTIGSPAARDDAAVPLPVDRLSSAPFRDAAVALMAAAKDAADAGKLARALEEVRSALAMRRSPEALHLAGLILNELGDRAASEKALQEAVERSPDYVLAHLSLGLMERPPGLRWLSGRHLGVVLQLLHQRSEDDLLPGPEPLSVGHARRLATVALADLVHRAASDDGSTVASPGSARSGGSR